MFYMVLDDDPARHAAYRKRLADHSGVHVWTVEEAKRTLDRSGQFDVVFLDHDLADYGERDESGYRAEFTGQDVARHIAAMAEAVRPKAAIIHSHNPPGSEAMRQILANVGLIAEVSPFEFKFGEPKDVLR